MNFLMLRGEYPKDRKDPTEILYDSLERETDMYTHLWYRVLGQGDRGTVLYFGHDYHATYAPNFDVRFQRHLKDFGTPDVPDVIFCRGALEEYRVLLERWPMALRVYYGAGKHFVPSNRAWDLVMVDSEAQQRKVRKGMGLRVELFLKPAAPHFRKLDCPKDYDICFVAVHPHDSRKRVEWVYDTVPKDLRVLQIGDKTGRPPGNVKIVHAEREDMPTLMNRCKVGIVPSTAQDSGPRVVPEFTACGLPVVASTDVHLNPAYRVATADLHLFWDVVRQALSGAIPAAEPADCQSAGRVLRSQIDAIWPERQTWKTN
jgi:glycosyltransferase involved in cell wall biosynthesis